MNLAANGADPSGDLLFTNFNQDKTSLAVGTRLGYKLFSLNSVEKLDEIHHYDKGDVCIVERLFSSSLVAIVSLSAPRKLKVCHFKKGTEICNYSYPNTILAVRLNRVRLLVVLEESLYIHNIRDMKVLHTIRDTPPNRFGLCALSDNAENCYLAYPGNNRIGEVQIFDGINLRAVTLIAAHDAPLAAITFNTHATLLATASEKGTVIRVFSIPDGLKLFEFRRGMKRCAQINSLAFSTDSLFLASSSNTETVHVFKLETEKTIKEEPSSQTWMGYFGKALMAPASYLPSQMTEVFSQGRAFAIAKLPNAGQRNICALAVINKLPRILVASADGYLYIYNLDPTDGQECPILRQFSLIPSEGDVMNVPEGEHYQAGLAVSSSRHASCSALSTSNEIEQNVKISDDNEFPPLTLRNE
ncbi:WD repeat domain phosphoinositide-interacting protein 2 isoform X1 [Hydra vulgaris]|uniref:WD repeat domain phosphoinositide-interacting protein 2 isoform X1 n=1 Tax=Hydra vulgaris TaxID=6087 RepID=UPI000640F56F|nr:WD repeat domain phosphoinositide-interacting protein 2 [Hydra vulgaris]